MTEIKAGFLTKCGECVIGSTCNLNIVLFVLFARRLDCFNNVTFLFVVKIIQLSTLNKHYPFEL